MITLTLIIAIIAGMLSAYTFLSTLALNDRLIDAEQGIKECATRTTTNKLHLNTLDNKVDKPKAKRGRPKKNVKPKLENQLNGKQ